LGTPETDAIDPVEEYEAATEFRDIVFRAVVRPDGSLSYPVLVLAYEALDVDVVGYEAWVDREAGEYRVEAVFKMRLDPKANGAGS
jgi:hypothetical protein